MAITFFIQSKKNPASIYVRIREGYFDNRSKEGIDAKAKTNLSINPDNFKKGKIKLHPKIAGATAEIKNEIQERNSPLIKLQENLDKTRNSLQNKLNDRKDYETINSKWLNNFLNPEEIRHLPKDLVSYFDHYIKSKQSSLKASTIKKMKVFKHRLKRYEDEKGIIYIQEVNKEFGFLLQEWCDKEKYAHNTKVKTIKTVLTVCNHARENKIKTHPELEFLTKGLKYNKTKFITLSFTEINKIIDAEIEDEQTDIARDWLIISFFTAQRVSDFLRFSKEKVSEIEGEQYLDISQNKTDKPIYIPLSDEVLKILDKRSGEFPPIFSTIDDSNATTYNKLLKKVCRIAKINNPITAFMKNKETNRYELKEVKKYEAVSSHIGRRSFSTNYFGSINTALLITATGHASESQFLQYVDKAENDMAKGLSRAMRDFANKEKQKLQNKNNEP